ncbi:hypothetical protein [Rhodoligotrophos ferricapiens]|uniref:hypothetical protein n=1 Tax=Rhodoligotrophos ferricapiens TaxID=3069264 RepID=UPI00315DA753
MISWLLRPILALSGVVAALLVARDALNFGVIQVMISLVLITALVGAAAFWPQRWTDWIFGRIRKT